MGLQPKKFANQDILEPGAYSSQSFPASPGSDRAPSNIVAVLGESEGGVPYNDTALVEDERFGVFTRVKDLQDVLRGGPAYYASEFFMTPTTDPNLAKPNQVLVFDPRPKTRATSMLQASAANIIKLTTLPYGVSANDFSRKIEAGTSAGKKFTLRYRGDVLSSRDNISLTYLSILYTGASVTATVTITAASLTTATTVPADNLTIDFTQVKKIGDLVNMIDGHESYTAVLLTSSDSLTTTLDAVAAQSILTTYNAKADVEALIRHVNGDLAQWITALYVGTSRVVPDNDASFVAFTGGTTSSSSNTDWANTLANMENQTINHIIVASGDPVKHGLVRDHCLAVSSAKDGQFRSWSSGASDTLKTVATRITECRELNTARGSYHFTSFTRRDFFANGERRIFEPFYMAAMTAGIMYANNLTISPTFQSLNVLALNEKYSKTQRNQIISAGGSYAIKGDNNESTIGHYLSTYQGSESLILNLPSMLRTADQVCLESNVKIRARLKSLKSAPTESQIEEIKTFLVSSMLPEFVSNGWLRRNPGSTAAPFTDVEFTIDGDSFLFKCRGNVATPMHYGFSQYEFVVPGTTA